MRSLWRRRHRAIAWFLLGYLAVWPSLGAALVGVLVAIGEPPPAVVLAAASSRRPAWQVSRPRRRVMRRCGSLPPAALTRGWRGRPRLRRNGCASGCAAPTPAVR